MHILVFVLLISLISPGDFYSDINTPGNHFLAKKQEQLTVRDTSYVRALNEKASDLITSGDLDSVSVLIKEAFNLADLLNDKEGKAYATANLGNYYLYKGRADSVIITLEEPYQRLNVTARALHMGNILGTAYYRTNEYSKSLAMYLEVLDRAKKENNKKMQAAITQNLGNTYSDLGDIPASVNRYLESLELAEELADTNTLAVVLDNLGSINTIEGNYEIAETQLQQALAYSKILGNVGYQITNHMNFGILYKDMGRYRESREYYEQVLELSGQIGNVFSPVQAKYNLGVLHSKMGDYDRALDYYRESLELSRQNNIKIGFYYNLSGMADIYVEREDYRQAIENYEPALKIAEDIRSKDLEKQILAKIYEAYELAGDSLPAYSYLKRYSSIIDNLSHTEREEALARQESMLELRTERERRELLEEAVAAQRKSSVIVRTLLGILVLVLVIVILLYYKKKQSNILLIKKTEELSEANEVKDKLLSVLAHDLRTPISNIQGVVYMIRENLLDKEDLDNALNHIDFQLQQGINTLTNYLEWAQNHREGISAELGNVQLLNVTEDAIHEIKKSANNKGIQIRNRVDNNTAVYADKHLMNVILRNLLSNAIKYVDMGDTVTISAIEKNSTVELLVADTGKGIPGDKLKTLFKPFSGVTRGTKGELGTGLGLAICKDFAEKQGGTIRCESELGKGTTFTVVVQKANNLKDSETVSAGKY